MYGVAGLLGRAEGTLDLIRVDQTAQVCVNHLGIGQPGKEGEGRSGHQ